MLSVRLSVNKRVGNFCDQVIAVDDNASFQGKPVNAVLLSSGLNCHLIAFERRLFDRESSFFD